MLEDYRLPVTDQGVVVPKVWFGAAKEVSLREVNGQIQIDPVSSDETASSALSYASDDPIWDLGKDPIKLGLTDASINHDKYIYGDPHRVNE